MRAATSNNPEKRPDEHLLLKALRLYVGRVLAEMVNNRDVKWDKEGHPIAGERASGDSAECTWVHLVVDMSAIGMPIDSPLIVYAYAGTDSLEWHLGATPLAQTARAATPKQAAD